MNYEDAFTSPSSAWIRQVRSGIIRYPLSSYKVDGPWYAHPPKLMPIMVSPSIPLYYGFYSEWFPRFRSTFVLMDLSLGAYSIELARTPEQFAFYLTIEAIVGSRSLDQVRRFAQDIGIRDFDRVYQHAVAYGDRREKNWLYWGTMAGMARAAITDQSQYDGWFALQDSNRTDSQEQSSIGKFNEFLRVGDYAKSWDEINKPGWDVQVAMGALRRLASAVQERTFSQYCDAWLALAATEAGSSY